MIPTIPNYAYRNIVIPELTGGINKSKDATLIDDNQLADGLNVWQNNGILQTRPGKKALRATINSVSKDIKAYDVTEVLGGTVEGKFILLIENESIKLAKIVDSAITDTVVNFKGQLDIGLLDYQTNIFFSKNEIYIITSYFDKADTATPWRIYKITVTIENGNILANGIRVPMENVYIPTIATNIGPVQNKQDTFSDVLSRSGVLYEGYSILANQYKIKYSTALRYNASDNNEYDEMVYRLPHDISKFVGSKITAKITDKNGKETEYSAIINENGIADIEKIQQNGVIRRMYVKSDTITFYDGLDQIATVDRKDYLQNNLEVTAPIEVSENDCRKVINMTFGEWYGGSASGIHGGTRLFLGGNTREDFKNLIVYSDINKPLYFSENTYAYVGNNLQRVTGFGKQGEELIIFKENELYSTQYTSMDISNSSVIVDIAASDVVFPIKQIHGYIGCDCPNTIQLCRNRLVWLSSQGKVYTLVSSNQYNEKTVYELSLNIEKPLKQHYSSGLLKNAVSADWEGHYVLSVVDGEFYLMDYNSYGFSSVYSYSKNESAQNNIPWWIWKFENIFDITGTSQNRQVMTVNSHNGELFFVEKVTDYGSDSDTTNLFFSFISKDNENIDEFKTGLNVDAVTKIVINSFIKTKTFDFGLPTLKKNVPKIEVVLGNNQGIPIYATVFTENGTDEKEIRLTEENNNIGELEYFQTEVIKPVNRINYRIALKLETEGKLEVSNLVLQYKRLGGKK